MVKLKENGKYILYSFYSGDGYALENKENQTIEIFKNEEKGDNYKNAKKLFSLFD